MIRTADELTADLAVWVSSVLPETKISTHPLGFKDRASGIDLRLLRAAPHSSSSSAKPCSVVDFDYLVTLQLSDAAAEQRAIGEFAFAILGRWDVEMVRGRNVIQICGSLGIPPAAGFVLRVPLRREHHSEPRPIVRAPLVVQTTEMAVITGRVVGARDIPVPGATVLALDLNRSARTDRDGVFEIGAAPAHGPVRVVARARGVEIEGAVTSGQAAVLHLPLEV